MLQDITPVKITTPIYISPYVTISRGKDSARKEYHKRISLNETPLNSENNGVEKIIAAYATPKAGATYFTHVLNENIKQLEDKCKEWETYKVNHYTHCDIKHRMFIMHFRKKNLHLKRHVI